MKKYSVPKKSGNVNMDVHRDLLVYGFIIKDKSFSTDSGEHRIRIFSMMDKLFYDYMWNGEVIECEELKGDT